MEIETELDQGLEDATLRVKSMNVRHRRSSCPDEASVARSGTELRLGGEGKSGKQDQLRNNGEIMGSFEAKQPVVW